MLAESTDGDLFVDCITEDDLTFDTTVIDDIDEYENVEVTGEVLASAGDILDAHILNEPLQTKKNKTIPGVQRLSLLSILNGNLKPKPTKPVEQEGGNKHKKVSVMDILGNQAKRQHSSKSTLELPNVQPGQILASRTEAIESKMYENASVRRTTAKDLLGSLRQKEAVSTAIIEVEDVVEVEQDLELQYKKSNDELEEKIYKNSASFSAKDILQRRPTTSKLNNSYMVTLKVPKRSKLVTLHINKDRLKSIKAESRKQTNAFFASMMVASKNSTIRSTKFQRLKDLPLPIIKLDQFHVFDNSEIEPKRDIHIHNILSKRTHKYCKPLNSLVEELRDTSAFPLKTYLAKDQQEQLYRVEKITCDDVTDFIESRIPNFQDKSQLKAIYDKFIVPGRRKPQNGDLWVNFFRPQQSLELLISDPSQRNVRLWLQNSFSKLRLQALKQPRNVLLKEKKRRQRNQQQNEFDSFIVDDYDLGYTDYGNGSETEEEIFVPLLLLTGPTGSCKSSSIYASMEELGGYVFEVNSGQARSRRDIWHTLKEFATTQIVQRQNMFKLDNITVPEHRPSKEADSGFQKGIILFEDVNILFEQDKTFWQLIQELLNISRRPIVLTCNNIDNIPKTILDHVEEDSILSLRQDEISKSLVGEFVWLCCFSQGFILHETILADILKQACRSDDMHYDLRSCLMECQFICQQYEELRDNEFFEIQKNSKPIPKIENMSLHQYAHSLSIISHGEAILANSYSLVNHDHIENEFLDLTVLDSANWLKQSTSIHELNVGDHLFEIAKQRSNYFEYHSLDTGKYIDWTKFLANGLRLTLFDFLCSRSKRKYRITRSATPMDSFSSENLASLLLGPEIRNPDLEGNIYRLNVEMLTLEFLPYARRWFYFQKKLNEIDVDNSVKVFLGYRVFNYESTALMNTFTFSWSMNT